MILETCQVRRLVRGAGLDIDGKIKPAVGCESLDSVSPWQFGLDGGVQEVGDTVSLGPFIAGWGQLSDSANIALKDQEPCPGPRSTLGGRRSEFESARVRVDQVLSSLRRFALLAPLPVKRSSRLLRGRTATRLCRNVIDNGLREARPVPILSPDD